MELETIIQQFLPNILVKNIQPIVSGLINHTYLVEGYEHSYILQNINRSVFNHPEILVSNHLNINQQLRTQKFDLQLPSPIKTKNGKLVYQINDDYWRLTEFVEDSLTYAKVITPRMAYNAAKSFAYFHSVINATQDLSIKESLAGFINFKKRLSDFEMALLHTNHKNRLVECYDAINFIKEHKAWVEEWQNITQNLPTRYIHGDPKISNILFDKNNQPIAIIDLDTVMEGTILYDFGDMIRSFTNLLNEDDVSTQENFNLEIYQAVKDGYLSVAKDFLTIGELENLDFAGKTIIFIQAMRFLTDYLNGDIYYDVSYENQNLDRTNNQINLLKGLLSNID